MKIEHTLRMVGALVFAGAMSVALPAAAQAPAASAGAPDAGMEKLREKIRADHRAVVAKNLPLTDAEAKLFWPVYDKCRAGIENAQRKGNRALLDFINDENSMTDTHAKKIAKEILAAEAEESRARTGCFDRVSKVLPGKKAARYLQIESKIRALSRFDVAKSIPLVD